MTFPALFLSHGAPNVILHDSPTRRFLAGLGGQLGTPRAIVVVSAHWEARVPTVNATERPKTIHDFFGFEPQLYEMNYAAPGAPALARELARRLESAGMRAVVDDARGLDHGVWVPLALMYPQADIPVTQVSVQPYESTQHHYLIGQNLRELRADNVLIIGSGNATHNLREMLPEGTEPPPWVTDFAGWLRNAVTAGDTGELLAYRDSAPFASKNHPTEEHFLPLFVALGAGTPGAHGRIIHSGISNGVLAMDAFAFD
ncbi:MAG: dioxygenase [Betaproteobacteria bacterium RBG_16_64_18]|nr:MAG: dioxygenase [Betaproteobacteria bacterium RBG_16_64_18]